MRFLSRLPWLVVAMWIASVSFCYIYTVDRTYYSHLEPNDEQIFGLVDAAVLISIGPMSKENLADYSIATLRKIGG